LKKVNEKFFYKHSLPEMKLVVSLSRMKLMANCCDEVAGNEVLTN